MPGCYDLGVRSSWYIRDKISHLERAEMIGSIQMVLCCIMKSDMINIPARGCQTFGQSRLRIPRRRKERCIRNPVDLYSAWCQMTSQAAFLLQPQLFLPQPKKLAFLAPGEGEDASSRIDNRVLVASGIFNPNSSAHTAYNPCPACTPLTLPSTSAHQPQRKYKPTSYPLYECSFAMVTMDNGQASKKTRSYCKYENIYEEERGSKEGSR